MNELIINSLGNILSTEKTYLSLLKYPYFNYINQIFTYTRSYEDAITFLIKLLDDLESYKDNFSEKDYQRNCSLIYTNELIYLYKLDRWEDFLANWNEIFNNVKFGNTYSKSVKQKQAILPYIISETDQYLIVHFLWGIHSKKVMVEKKVFKMQNGYKIENLLHDKQSDLTYDEIKERFDWIVNYRLTGKYDYAPPASQQKKKKS